MSLYESGDNIRLAMELFAHDTLAPDMWLLGGCLLYFHREVTPREMMPLSYGAIDSSVKYFVKYTPQQIDLQDLMGGLYESSNR